MDKRDKMHGREVSKADYIERLVSIHFGWTEDPQFRLAKFSGIQAVGLSSDKVYIYVLDNEAAELVENELVTHFEEDEREWVKVSIIGQIAPAQL